ncbi:hypothetical protein PM082_014508 [Marasmius tenuissimus]|nr:hypothetical protein PM082_014508 [Marasmius tenuissimus]
MNNEQGPQEPYYSCWKNQTGKIEYGHGWLGSLDLALGSAAGFTVKRFTSPSLCPPSLGMAHNSSFPSSKIRDFSTNNYGDRSATYNNNVFHNTCNNPARPARSGVDSLAGYTAPNALHSSSSRNTQTGVLEGTRVALIEKLSRWIEDSSKKHRACWVHGGAGVGKSAVAQTICEISRRKSQLAASFFFSRNDTSRSTLNTFIPTLAHQLATSPPLQKAGLSSLIDDAVRQNPSGLERMNLEGQFQSLLFQPCIQIHAKQWENMPKLVVIDGFDECMGGAGTISSCRAQEALLSIIHNALSADPPLPLCFMIFSRPESTIRNFFHAVLVSHESVDMRGFRAQADSDIRKYLKKEFAHLSDSQPEILVAGPWPGSHIIEKLVGKADGHFIYVVIAMKYITANNPSLADLRQRLDGVLHTVETTSHPDLSDLDQLYHTILRRFGRDDLQKQLLLPVLQLMITPHPRNLDVCWPRSQSAIAALLKIDLNQCSTFLSQLRSVLYVPNDPQKGNVSILHASLSDFLGEARRSHEFHVQPMSLRSYLDGFSWWFISTLRRKIQGEQMKLADRKLERWSIGPWRMVQQLSAFSVGDYTLSEELVSAVAEIDLYGYLNTVLEHRDPEYSNRIGIRYRESTHPEDAILTCCIELEYPDLGLRIDDPLTRPSRVPNVNRILDNWFTFTLLLGNILCLQDMWNSLKVRSVDNTVV